MMMSVNAFLKTKFEVVDGTRHGRSKVTEGVRCCCLLQPSVPDTMSANRDVVRGSHVVDQGCLEIQESQELQELRRNIVKYSIRHMKNIGITCKTN